MPHLKLVHGRLPKNNWLAESLAAGFLQEPVLHRNAKYRDLVRGRPLIVFLKTIS